jgi:hypothetical protein
MFWGNTNIDLGDEVENNVWNGGIVREDCGQDWEVQVGRDWRKRGKVKWLGHDQVIDSSGRACITGTEGPQ